jgi:hypothetical protein
MSNKLKLLTGNYFNMSQYAALAKWAIIAALVSAVGYFAVDHYNSYTDLQKTVKEQAETIKQKEGTIKTLTSENSTKDTVIGTLQATARVSEQAAEEDLKKKTEQEEFFKSIETKRQTEEREVKSKKVTYKKQPKGSTEPPVVDDRNLETKLSDIRITSIIDTYCASPNVKNPQLCPGNLTNLNS